MEASAESYEPAFRGKRDRKRDRKSKKQRIAKPISTSETETTATDAEHPRASLLGLPKELLNYIITLAVVEEPDADQITFMLKQREETSVGPPGKIPAYRSPALARTCTELEAIVLPVYYGQNVFAFCNAGTAHEWLRHERRGQDQAPVRQIKIYFDPDLFNTEEYASMVISLEDKADMLAIRVESAYYLNMCNACQSILASKVEEINRRDHYDGSKERRLAALAYELSCSSIACGIADGCTKCYGRT